MCLAPRAHLDASSSTGGHDVSRWASRSTLPGSVVLLPLVGRNCAVDLGKERCSKSARQQWYRDIANGGVSSHLGTPAAAGVAVCV